MCFSSAQEVISTIRPVLAVDCILSDVGAVLLCELIKSMLPSRPVRFQGFFFGGGLFCFLTTNPLYLVMLESLVLT